jgi:hypothetical protein
MIESIDGKRGLPRHRPPYIAEIGLFGRPTLNHNVETLWWLRDIIERGAQWFGRACCATTLAALTAPGAGDDLDVEAYSRFHEAAIHMSPAKARATIYQGSKRAARRFLADPESFSLIDLSPPYERKARFRPWPAKNLPAYETTDTHPTSVAELLNMPFRPPEETET